MCVYCTAHANCNIGIVVYATRTSDFAIGIIMYTLNNNRHTTISIRIATIIKTGQLLIILTTNKFNCHITKLILQSPIITHISTVSAHTQCQSQAGAGIILHTVQILIRTCRPLHPRNKLSVFFDVASVDCTLRCDEGRL